ncbi:MAG: rod shape-determining protein MreB [Selenomonadaceae bacterium]|nr:rod shape-determining protein MreB [Selenomonadaceae bacterium]MBQ7630158.1 rod shape-determining protein MreB [Selenomonadaceae bacterium]
MSTSVGIDLGTANVLVYVKGKGIVLREPSVVAVDKENDAILAIGEEAREMIGRTPGNIVAIKPLRDGVISDYDMTEAMIRHFLEKVVGRSFLFRPRVMICVPTGVTVVEKRAVQEAAEQAGAKTAELIEEPIAAALGAGIDIAEPVGSMVVDIGGGTCDVAVISLGGIVNGSSLRVAGNQFDSDIEAYIKRKHNLMIGERTAENIKTQIGAAFEGARRETLSVRGRDVVSGLPKTVTVTTDEAVEALKDSIDRIILCVREVLEETPPELAADIMDRGIILTGGGAMLYGLAELIRKETDIPTSVADDPLSCVAIGTGKALEGIR